ncbi:MAG: acetyl/propionyl/methylcrotonyl-CoA carboxylase subunit alpha [Burkholderiaceae bacterium]|jgi:3-methylcrotonyl-CoA carboxylase alpha subunit|nr:acetyl/propionyl/methylcrotonyl-CoA carboxylase subunit alpha [Burkholderiaceae bacterium]
MFTKILIANRGEIACRVAATAKRLGIQTVAVYADADAEAMHVKACDEAVHIGGSAPAQSYLQWQRILDAARATGAQAVHPGYGFLSENDAFATACAEAGLVFIGPKPASIRAMGLKAESKRLMANAGVPLVPGYHGENQDSAFLQEQADVIGYPVLIKASAGGGGKGMRVVSQAGDFAAALSSCQREAINSFANDAVLIEKYVQRPRHIEIQIFGDNHGNCVSLFERDCSVQRRHQKVLEEAPAPGMTAAMRLAMGEAAVAAAKAVQYVGAGTVEFIVEQADDGAMSFYFMEMNTRLQVEHPVTEAVTGLDLVAWQLRVAAGEPLPKSQDQLQLNGHAIEARICAENPNQDFLPATGPLWHFSGPEASHFCFTAGGVRLDTGVTQGDVVSPFYDSMLAKLIVWGADRDEALAKLDKALSEMQVVGVANNVAFLRDVVQSASFSQGDLDTDLIARERDNLFKTQTLSEDLAVAGVMGMVLRQEVDAMGSNPWQAVDGWQVVGAPPRPFQLQGAWGDEVRALDVVLYSAPQRVRIADTDHAFEWRAHPRGVSVCLNGVWTDLSVVASAGQYHVFSRAGHAVLQRVDPLAGSAQAADALGGLNTPMPGKLIRMDVAVGDTVAKGQVLAVMEAMKMEHSIASPRDGVVSEVFYAVGDQVAEGQALLTLQDVT